MTTPEKQEEMPGQHLACARTAFKANRLAEAEAAARSAIGCKPEDPQAHLLLAATLVRQNRLGDANDTIDLALVSAGETPPLLAMASELRQIAGRLSEAGHFMERALALAPNNVHLRFQHAHLLLSQCQYTKAIAVFSALSAGNFFRSEAHAGLAHAWERLGDLDKASEQISLALEHGRQPSVGVLCSLADIASQTDAFPDAAGKLEQGLRSKNLTSHQLGELHFALGRLYDKAGNYDKAFEHIDRGNKLLAPVHDWTVLGRRCDALRDAYSRDSVRNMPRAANLSERPVFIVGFPRSGTSLVERLLAAHPDVHGAGELEHIHMLARSIARITNTADPHPEGLRILGHEKLNLVAEEYIAHLQRIGGDSRRITDKMPGNLMYLGLINALFPGARVIYCMRDPLDTCLSCYFQRFNQSNNLAYTFSLEALGYYWEKQQGLMQHWKSVLDIQMIEVEYETLVREFEPTARMLIDFCGLEWDDAILSYHQSTSNCVTASYQQVRRPIYSTSISRWRNYEQHLQPLVKRFGRLHQPIK